MAQVYVTFSKAQRAEQVPVMIGSAARTEIIDSGSAGGTSPGALTCAGGQENIVDIYAVNDVWLAIGASPAAEAGSGDSRFMAAGERMQFWVIDGDSVAILEP